MLAWECSRKGLSWKNVHYRFTFIINPCGPAPCQVLAIFKVPSVNGLRAEGAWLGRQVGGKPDFADPVVMSADRGGTTIDALCRQIHKTLIADFQYSLVWGTSSKHYPQRRAPAPTCHHSIAAPSQYRTNLLIPATAGPPWLH